MRAWFGIFGKALNSNRPFSGWWRYRLPGYGSINWAQFIATLNEIGYDDVLAIEHEDEIYYGSPELNYKGLLMSKKYLEQFIV